MSRGTFLGLAIVAVASSAFSWLIVAQSYWIDDSFISFRYARNLSAGHGLVFNAGEPVEGYTNFLWLMLCWAGTTFHASILHVAQALGLAAQIGTVAATFALARTTASRSSAALLAPVLLAANVAFLTYPMTGMETTAFTLAAALVGASLVAGIPRRPLGLAATALLTAALSTIRFDGFVLVVILYVAWVLVYREWRRALWLLGIAAALVAGYHAWRVSFYPTPFPNTFYAKTAFSVDRAIEGLRYLARVGLWEALPLYAFAALAIVWKIAPRVLRWRTRVDRALAFCALVVIGQGAYVMLVGGDWMPHGRFAYHVMPFLAVLAAAGIRMLPKRRTLVPVVAAVSWIVLFVPTVRALTVGDVRQAEVHSHWFHPHDAAQIGRHLDRAIPADALIAIEWAGVIPYHVRQPVLDTFGITDREITTRADFRASPFGRFITVDYLAGRNPDLVCPCGRTFPTAAEAAAAIAPGGVARYRFYPELIERDFGYRLRVMRVGPNAYWPAIVRIGGRADQ